MAFEISLFRLYLNEGNKLVPLNVVEMCVFLSAFLLRRDHYILIPSVHILMVLLYIQAALQKIITSSSPTLDLSC